MSSRILRVKQVCELVGLSRSSILRMERDGRFPSKINLSVHAVGWRESDVLAWIDQRAKA